MNSRRGGLGRGLGALIPTGPDGPPATAGAPVPGAYFREVPLSAITPNPRQPRTYFEEEALDELVSSIREVGMLQPVVVREVGPERFELVMGERRWRAARTAGLETVPAIVRDTADDAMLRDALLENLHRQQLNPLEEAAAYQQMLEDFATTHEELATKIGRSRSQVTNMLRLLNLPPAVQRKVAAGVLSAGHARALLALPTPEEQDRVASRVVAEGLSVRAVEELVAVTPTPETRAPKARALQDPRLREVAAELSEHLETRVKVELGRSKGKITVEFAGLDDLKRIVRVVTGRGATVQPELPREPPSRVPNGGIGRVSEEDAGRAEHDEDDARQFSLSSGQPVPGMPDRRPEPAAPVQASQYREDIAGNLLEREQWAVESSSGLARQQAGDEPPAEPERSEAEGVPVTGPVSKQAGDGPSVEPESDLAGDEPLEVLETDQDGSRVEAVVSGAEDETRDDVAAGTVSAENGGERYAESVNDQTGGQSDEGPASGERERQSQEAAASGEPEPEPAEPAHHHPQPPPLSYFPTWSGDQP